MPADCPMYDIANPIVLFTSRFNQEFLDDNIQNGAKSY